MTEEDKAKAKAASEEKAEAEREVQEALKVVERAFKDAFKDLVVLPEDEIFHVDHVLAEDQHTHLLYITTSYGRVFVIEAGEGKKIGFYEGTMDSWNFDRGLVDPELQTGLKRIDDEDREVNG